MKTSQLGVTLIELMISLVIGLVVIAGISSLFLQMQKSNRMQRGLSEVTSEAAYAQEVLQKELRRTNGLRSRSDINGSADRIFLAHNNVLASGLNFSVEEYIKGDTLAAVGNDSFIIRYQLLDSNDLSTNVQSNSNSVCTRNALLGSTEDPATQPHVVSVRFYVSNNMLYCNAQRTKPKIVAAGEDCVANCTSVTDFTPDSTRAAIPIMDDVEKIGLTYGVRINNGTAATPNYSYYYANAATINAAATSNPKIWNKIVSIRITLVAKSEMDFLTNTPATYTFNSTEYTPTDRRLYKVFTTTVALRNAL